MAANKRILIVDDDEIIQNLFRRITERLGVEGVPAYNATEAKTKLKEGPGFDLILLDLILPSENGWDLLDEIKKDPRNANVPIIIITGAQLSQSETGKLLKLVSAVVQKGAFDLSKFTKLLDEML